MLKRICNLAKKAGKEIMKIYNSKSFLSSYKSDFSPVTEADILSHKILITGLKNINSSLPILSEENLLPWSIRKKWKTYWLIDPLDGTKEFIKKNGEFTVNIALIEKSEPVLGVIYVPLKNQLYFANKKTAWKESNGNKIKLSIQNKKTIPIKILVSRSHDSKNYESKIKNYLSLSYITEYEILKMGSSLKFCLIAENFAQMYLRFENTSIWDTAAGEVIVKASGANICDLKGKNLNYSQKSFLNPGFQVYI